MVDRVEFDRLVRDALANLYDIAALGNHPLGAHLPRPAEYSGSRAEYLRAALMENIEKLRPAGQIPIKALPEWRAYLILYNRYVEGISLQDLQVKLSLSERQLRREHGRALQAVSVLLWEQAFPHRADEPVQPEKPAEPQSGDSFQDYKINLESLDLGELLNGVFSLVRLKAQADGIPLIQEIPSGLPSVSTDRVILRQVLIQLLNYALTTRSSGEIVFTANVEIDSITLSIDFQTEEQSLYLVENGRADLKNALYWIGRMGGRLDVVSAPGAQGAAQTSFILTLPRTRQPLVMIVDDQEPAVRMYQRYLNQLDVRIVGVQEAEQVLPAAIQLHPDVIFQDVMMPTMDGWEILQALKANPDTRAIPVIVCSVWNEPGMAFALGAFEFMKKPISRSELVSALVRLKILDISDECSPADL